MSSGNARLRSPEVPFRPRSPSAPWAGSAEYQRRTPDSYRRNSGETTYSASTAITDDESVAGSADERYYKSRRNWNGGAGGTANGFYKGVADDYKNIVKNVGEDAMTRRSPKLKHQEFGNSSPRFGIVVDDDTAAPQELVPAGEELWG